MKYFYILSVLCLLSITATAQEYITLWEKGKMPNSKGLILEHIEARERVTQVATPGMYAFFPPLEERNGTSVLIPPGGGYHHLTYNLGGFQLAKWLNTQGITAFVLMYRLPTSPDLINPADGPVQDGQRALQIIRQHAEDWKLDSTKVGVLGTSAGGHLASYLGTHDKDITGMTDTTSTFGVQPNFMILVSPVISMESDTHQGSVTNLLGEHATDATKKAYSTQYSINATTPPTFLAHAENDPAVPPSNSLRFYTALLKNNVNASLHIFPRGKHAIGIYNASEHTNQWKALCIQWLKELAFITSPK
ncbi:alpha/beta hydrolase [Neptunitalea lumnitzerae]|uniref:Beta-xylanase n=1 Tax=Neptunitalea lumnitzerae TaxID=2965509 RepID=A0ABQ5MF83_9FLAO|nr:alpha/beta hydrolase [Neptunitalea sp. Y10]GLB48053.1 beta-xylanase [Neptunitalea sp. Y10]